MSDLHLSPETPADAGRTGPDGGEPAPGWGSTCMVTASMAIVAASIAALAAGGGYVGQWAATGVFLGLLAGQLILLPFLRGGLRSAWAAAGPLLAVAMAGLTYSGQQTTCYMFQTISQKLPPAPPPGLNTPLPLTASAARTITDLEAAGRIGSDAARLLREATGTVASGR